MRFPHSLGVALLGLWLAGCANDPAPHEQMRLTEQTLQQARAVGVDQSIASMQLAQGKYARAQKNMGEQDYKRARQFAEQAEVDARLAEATLLTRKSGQQLQEINRRIQRVRQQLEKQP